MLQCKLSFDCTGCKEHQVGVQPVLFGTLFFQEASLVLPVEDGWPERN